MTLVRVALPSVSVGGATEVAGIAPSPTSPRPSGSIWKNASSPAELGWVQANRLAVVEERPSGATVVHLDRAHEPARPGAERKAIDEIRELLAQMHEG